MNKQKRDRHFFSSFTGGPNSRVPQPTCSWTSRCMSVGEPDYQSSPKTNLLFTIKIVYRKTLMGLRFRIFVHIPFPLNLLIFKRVSSNKRSFSPTNQASIRGGSQNPTHGIRLRFLGSFPKRVRIFAQSA